MYEQWHHASEFLGIRKWRNELWHAVTIYESTKTRKKQWCSNCSAGPSTQKAFSERNSWQLFLQTTVSCNINVLQSFDQVQYLSPSFSGNWNFNDRNASMKGIDSMSPMVPPSSIMPRRTRTWQQYAVWWQKLARKEKAYYEGLIWQLFQLVTFNLSISFHVRTSKPRELIAMRCHTCETLVYICRICIYSLHESCLHIFAS